MTNEITHAPSMRVNFFNQLKLSVCVYTYMTFYYVIKIYFRTF